LVGGAIQSLVMADLFVKAFKRRESTLNIESKRSKRDPSLDRRRRTSRNRSRKLSARRRISRSSNPLSDCGQGCRAIAHHLWLQRTKKIKSKRCAKRSND